MAYDLEEQESLAQLKAWWDKWGNLTLSCITVICLAFAGYNGWHWYKRYQGGKATVAYVQLQNAYVQNDEKNVRSLSDGLMKEYSSHVFASLAALMKANVEQKAGNLNAARAALNWVINEGGHPEYATVARVRLAGVELDAKDANKAKAALDAIDPAQAQMPLVLDRRGDVLLALGDVDGARKCWEDALERDRASGELLALLSLKIQALPEKKS